jgi:membrane-associated protease RseP (regulator of RpoE activity)
MSTLSSVGVVGLGATARGVIPATRRGARARVAARPVASTRAGETSSSVAWAHRGSRRLNSGARGDAVVRRGFLDRLFGGDKKGSDDAKGDDVAASKPADAPEANAEAPTGAPTATAPADGSGAPVAPSPVPTPKVRVEYDMPKPDYNNTMSALDSMIGSTDEELMREEEARADDAAYAEATKRREERDAAKASSDDNDGVTLSVAPGVLDAIEQAEKARKGGGAVDPELKGSKPTGETNEETKKKIQVTLDDKAVKQMLDKDSWLDNVVDGLSESAERERDDRSPEENAKLDKVLADLSDLAKKDKGERSSDEVREKFESLFEILEISDEPAVPKEDLERLKTEVFGYNTFWVTGTEELGAEIAGEGVLVKGNLRAPRQAVFEKVQAGCDRLFPGKYTVFVLEEPGGLFDDDSSSSASTSGSFDSSDPTASSRGPRVSFLIVPADKAGPNPSTSGWQYLIATVLFALTAGSALQLGLVAEVSRLPQATMDWLAAGSQGIDTTLAPGELPPGLEDFDVQRYVESAFPIAGGIWATTAAHEVGHMIAASVRGVKIGIPFLIPNGQLGTFGSITQIKSLPKTREDIFDVAVAGPIAGTVVASTLFFVGLALSAGGDPNELLPIPSELFSGSLLLGSVSEIFLGDTAAAAKGVMVHPLFIAGWYALILFPSILFPPARLDNKSREDNTPLYPEGCSELPKARRAEKSSPRRGFCRLPVWVTSMTLKTDFQPASYE